MKTNLDKEKMKFSLPTMKLDGLENTPPNIF
jgi:hypothetical protein